MSTLKAVNIPYNKRVVCRRLGRYCTSFWGLAPLGPFCYGEDSTRGRARRWSMTMGARGKQAEQLGSTDILKQGGPLARLTTNQSACRPVGVCYPYLLTYTGRWHGYRSTPRRYHETRFAHGPTHIALQSASGSARLAKLHPQRYRTVVANDELAWSWSLCHGHRPQYSTFPIHTTRCAVDTQARLLA